MEKHEQRSRKKKSLGVSGLALVGGGIMAAALIAAFAYIQVGRSYQKVFFPKTVINGMDVSKKSVMEVKKMIALTIDDYKLTLQERGGTTEEIKGMDIGLEAVFDGKLESLLGEQKPLSWAKHLRKPQSFEIGTMIQYDQNKFDTVVNGLSCLKVEEEDKAQNASISDYVSGQGYQIKPARDGKELNPEKLKSEISNAVMDLKPELNLDEAGAYISPKVPTNDPGLVSKVQTMNKYVNTTITYNFGDEKKVLSGDTISKWVKTDDSGQVYLDSKSVSDYVKELASTYDTAYKAKNFTTSTGQNVKITGGSYGWRINQSAEADELAELIRSGNSQVREPVYKQRGASRGAKDYGNTYVEINLTAQHIYYYKDGKLVVESDFVSGNESKGWSTPAGAYSLTYKERNATLKGENYRTPVDYWMPFNGNIGLHDAKWRSTFGGSIYKTSGSHGCINLPPAVAKTIFENISAGIPVLCYHLPGTESLTTSNGTGKKDETKGAQQPTTQAGTQPTTPAATHSTTQAATQPATQPTTAAPTTAAPTTAPAATTPTTVSAHPSFDQEAGPGSSKSSGKNKSGPGM